MKKLIRRYIRWRIAKEYCSHNPSELNKVKKYAEYVFSAPMRKWRYRLRIVLQFGGIWADEASSFDKMSDFILGEPEKIAKRD